jgi:hypothetical protein
MIEPITIVNRSVLLVRAKDPVCDWLQEVLPSAPPLTLKEMNVDCSTYLVPETEDDDDGQAILRIAFTTIFECQLADWCTDPDSWPDIHDRAIFDRWFDCSFHSVVTDLAPGLIGPWEN